MSIYLNQIPENVKFKNNEKTLVIEFDSEDTKFYFNEALFVNVCDIDFIIDSLESIKSIPIENNKKEKI
jgi:hypothetical protein